MDDPDNDFLISGQYNFIFTQVALPKTSLSILLSTFRTKVTY